jgi:hypothetical protein
MALRGFSDREGKEWRVWSVVPGPSAAVTLDEEFRGGWLCFERAAGGERRRLAMTQAPDGWEALPDERLDLLRRVATPVAPPPLDGETTGPVTGKRPIENAALDRPSSARGSIGGEERVDL